MVDQRGDHIHDTHCRRDDSNRLVDLKMFFLFTRADKEVLTGYFAAILCSTGSQVSCSFLTKVVMTSSGVMARE